MCGIVGFIGPTDGLAPERLDRMTDALAHRGPDARGVRIEPHGAYGHRRLAILDLDRRSDQPMVDAAGRTIVFNGEIYNFAELRRELEPHHAFRTTGDTEVILAAYARWGTGCFARCNGDWALAIHDPVRRCTVLARDRLGIKPLYAWRGDGGTWFASEIKALLAGPLPARTSVRSLLTFVQRGHIEPGNWCLVEGVEAFPAAHWREIAWDGGERTEAYWGNDEIFGADVPSTYDDAVEACLALVDDAVALRMVADVPVGICLSGGLDSSLITALAARRGAGRVSTFSGVAPGQVSDESRYSAAVAAQWRTDHHPIELRTEDLFEALAAFVQAQETGTSTFSTIGRERVLREAARHVKVVLDGQGGDELLAGYYGLHRAYRELAGGTSLATLEMDETPVGAPREKIDATRHFRPDAVRGVAPHPKLRVPEPDDADELTRRQLQRLRGPGLLGLLHTEDRLTMRHSIEGRVPLLDHRLVEFCMSMPFEFRIGERDKRILRDAAARHGLLPPLVTERTDKRGFTTPYPALLASDAAFRRAFAERLATYEPSLGEVFDFGSLREALARHADGGVDASNVLVRCVSLMCLIERFGLAVVA